MTSDRVALFSATAAATDASVAAVAANDVLCWILLFRVMMRCVCCVVMCSVV